jgi:hypothetical protein
MALEYSGHQTKVFSPETDGVRSFYTSRLSMDV